MLARRSVLRAALWLAALCLLLVVIVRQRPPLAAQSTALPVNSVSAASFERAVARESIATAFGERLAPSLATATALPLPTTLNGVSVTVGGHNAGLFFVSPTQINYALPPEAAAGEPEVVVRLNGNLTHRGTIFIAEVAPVVFTFNADGTGVPAATAVRAVGATQTFETIAQRNGTTFVPKPINLGAANERVFLILYLAGVRRLPNSDNNSGNGVAENVRVLLGGLERTPSFAGAAPGFAGVDQINLELPRELIARGKVKLAIAAAGFTSNESELEFDGLTGPRPPVIRDFAPTLATAGETLNINGSNFSAVKAENAVSIGGTETREIDTASANQLIVRVPYGVESGPVVVRTTQGGQGASAAAVAIRTTVSGFVEDTQRRPLPGVRVRAVEANISTTTNAEGAFLLRDVPPTAKATVEIDPTSLALNYASVKLSKRVLAGRDHHLNRTPIQQVNGPGLGFGSSNLTADTEAAFTETVAPTVRAIQTGGVTFAIADETTAVFPNGATSGTIFLSIVESSRVPVNLPPGIFSSTVAQLTPFGTKLTPGGKLTFPNADGLAANAQARLYRLDQTAGSATLGQFIDAGAATVSADGRLVETATNAITETSIFFAAVPRPLTTVVGRVVESDGTPVRGALVSTRGQEIFTDGNGGFTMRNVPIPTNNLLNVEASYERPNGRVDRVQRNGIAVAANGLTRVTPDLVLPSATTQPNRPPTLIAPPTIALTEGLTRDLGLIVSAPDPNQTISSVTVTGAAFASIVQNQAVFTLRLAPGAGTAGNYTLTLRATDSQNAGTTQTVAVTVAANRPPVLTVPGTQTATVGQQLAFNVTATDPDEGQTLTLTATGLPSGATFNQTNATTGRFTWTPGTNQSGVFMVSFTAGDNVTPRLSDSKSVTLNISGGTAQWTRTAGPGTGRVTALAAAASGAGVFAGTSNQGFFRSFDNGFTWQASNSGLGNGSEGISALALNNTALFAATYSNGVYRSQDNGLTWAATNNSLNPQVNVLLAVGNTLLAGTNAGLYRTTDNGTNWNRVTESFRVTSLAANGNTLFAGTGGGILRSTNDGVGWSLIGSSADANVRALAVSGTALFAAYIIIGNGETIVARSLDNGATWAGVTNPSDFGVNTFAVNGTTVYAVGDNGVFRTTDNGTTWTAFNEGLTNRLVNASAFSGNFLLAGTDGGVFSRVQAGPACFNPPAGLVSWYRGEGTGDDAKGIHPGTLRNGIAFGTGIVGRAFTFDGVDDAVELGNWFNFQTFTLALWIRPGTTQTTYANVIDNNHTDARAWVLQQNVNTLNQYTWGVAVIRPVITFNLTADVWQYVVMTLDANRVTRVYVNGVQVGQESGSQASIYDGTQFLRLGSWGGGGRNWRGLLDEVDVYNRLLSIAEIQALFNAGSTGKCR